MTSTRRTTAALAQPKPRLFLYAGCHLKLSNTTNSRCIPTFGHLEFCHGKHSHLAHSHTLIFQTNRSWRAFSITSFFPNQTNAQREYIRCYSSVGTSCQPNGHGLACSARNWSKHWEVSLQKISRNMVEHSPLPSWTVAIRVEPYVSLILCIIWSIQYRSWSCQPSNKAYWLIKVCTGFKDYFY